MADEILRSRRGWLKGMFSQAADAVAQPIAETVIAQLPVRRRPPYAIAEPLFLAGCDACGDCVQACPEGAIFVLNADVNIGPGTPVMRPDQRACLMCDGFPCAAACPPKVLLVPVAEDGVAPPAASIGTVVLDPAECLPFRGPECGACARLCPTETQALTMRLRKPVIDGALCVGCGKCIDACITTPKSIRMVPLS